MKNTRRLAALLKRIPKWETKGDRNEIRRLFKERPEGCHIDHYYPLLGEFVSGLHTPTNLYYIAVNTNLQKGNKTPGIDWPENKEFNNGK